MIAFLAGAATVLAFAPVGMYPLALVTLGLLVHLWSRASPRRCFWSGFWFGLGLFGAGVSWVYVSLSQYGGMAPPLAALGTALLCALLALFPAAAGWLQARIPASQAVRACLLIPAAWTLGEWLRSWVLSGFPWLSAGYAAVAWPLQGYGAVLGLFGLSFITVALAGLIWLLFLRKKQLVAALAMALVIAGGEALRHVDWATPVGAPVAVALLQGNTRQEMKFRPEHYANILETYARLAAGTSARLIVLPETAVPEFLDRIDPGYLAGLEAIARSNGGDLLLGVPYQDGPAEYYNSVVSLGASGRQLYHKVHLVPFGEFAPPGLRWVLDLVQIPLSDFARGAPGQKVLAAAGERVAVNVCYEDAFGAEIARRLPDASLLVNVSNVAWFGDSLAPAQHLQIARLRAIETARSYLTASNTGVTAAIDRDGRVLARLPQFTEGRLEIATQGYRGATPYVRFGDWPVLIASLLLLGAAVFIARRQPVESKKP